MTLKRRDFLRVSAAAAGAAVFAPAIVRAADFPTGPVQLVVPFSPGGGADRTSRLFAPYLSEELGVPVNVINIQGGGGWVAWQQMANWDPQNDDHIIGMINFPHVFSYLDPRMQRSETTDSFNFLCWHSLDPCIWAIRADEDRFTDLPSLIEYVAANPNSVTFSTTAVGSDDHMGIAFAEKFVPDFSVKKLYANGDNKKIQELLGGVSDVVAGNVGYFSPYVEQGQMKFITVLHPERYHEIPDVPTFSEVTGEKNVSFAGRTLAVAPGLAGDKYDTYLAAVERAIQKPAYVAAEKENRNNLLFMKGEQLQERIANTRDYVESVRFWEQES